MLHSWIRDAAFFCLLILFPGGSMGMRIKRCSETHRRGINVVVIAES